MTGCQAKVLVTLINRQNCCQPERLYRDLRSQGSRYLQFIPLQARDNPASITDQQWAAFLTAVFDVWVREDIGRISVQLFDSALEIWRGNPPPIYAFPFPTNARRARFVICATVTPCSRGLRAKTPSAQGIRRSSATPPRTCG